jgi:hypothetical protein
MAKKHWRDKSEMLTGSLAQHERRKEKEWRRKKKFY